MGFPIVGGDYNTWGSKLDLLLGVAHNGDGSLKVFRSITDDGAVCNGTADDTASIQTTIAYVQNAGGGSVIVPGFSKISSTIAVTADNVQIIGVGWNSGLIAASGFGANPMIWYKYPGSSLFRYGAVIRDLFLNGNNVAGIIGVEFESTYHALLDHVRIRYCSGNAIYCFGNSSARGAYTCIRDCALTDGGAGTAVLTAYHENSVIRGGLIAWWDSSGGIGFEPQDSDWLIEGVHFDECNTSIQLQFCTGAIIKGCSFDRGYTNFINVNGSVNAQIIANNFNNRAGSGTDMIQMQNSSTKACLVADNVAIAGTSWTNFIKEQSGTGTPISSYLNNDVGGLAIVRQNGIFRGNRGYNPIGSLMPPSVPSSTSSYTNGFGYDCTVYVTSPDYKAITLAKVPIRYYRLDETSGTTAHDLGSGAQNGTLHGGITLAQPGLLFRDIDTCFTLDGTSGYISVPTSGMPTGAAAWTMECWVRMPHTITGTYATLMEFGTFGGSANQGVRLDYGGGFGNVFAIDNANYSQIASATSIVPAADGIYHLVATYDGTAMRLYINAELAASTNYTFNIALAQALIGGAAESGGWWPNRLDEPAWYNFALSQAQITEAYLMGAQQFGNQVTDVLVGGVSTGRTSGDFRLPAQQSITVDYTVAPTWTWFAD
jgi:hypothetical protein